MSHYAILFAALATSSSAMAQPPGASALDFDRDGRISRLELMIGVEFWSDPITHRTLLRDSAETPPVSDAKVSADTREIHYPYFLRKHRLMDLPFHRLSSIDAAWFPFSKAEMRPARKPDLSQRRVRIKDSPLIKVRRDADDLTAQGDNRKGALFSFTHDFTANADQWLARGIISVGGEWEVNGSWREDHPDAPLLWNYYGLHASMLFDHVQGKGGPETEIDVLEFSLSSFGLTTPLIGNAGLLLKADLVDSTDFDFDRHLVGGVVEVEPVLPEAGLHGILNFPPGKVTGRIKIRAEGGGLASGEDDPASEKDETFLRIGPVAELAFYPALATENRFKLYVKGSFLGSIAGSEDSKLFVAGAGYSLPIRILRGRYDTGDIDGRLSLNVEYRNGELPFNAKRDESIVVGLGILF